MITMRFVLAAACLTAVLMAAPPGWAYEAFSLKGEVLHLDGQTLTLKVESADVGGDGMQETVITADIDPILAGQPVLDEIKNGDLILVDLEREEHSDRYTVLAAEKVYELRQTLTTW